jgi:hypothetical protein
MQRCSRFGLLEDVLFGLWTCDGCGRGFDRRHPGGNETSMRAGIHPRLSKTYSRQGVMVIVFVVGERAFVFFGRLARESFSGDNHLGLVMDFVDEMYTGAMDVDSWTSFDLN